MLIIDNYDSFTYNIVQYIKMLGIEPIVIKMMIWHLMKLNHLILSVLFYLPGGVIPITLGLQWM